MAVADKKQIEIDQVSLLDILLEDNLISEEDYKKLKKESRKKDIARLIQEQNLVNEEALTEAKGKFLKIPYIDLFGRNIPPDTLNIIPQEIAQTYRVVAFDKVDNEISVAMENPNDYKALEAIEFLARENKLKVKYFIISPSGLNYVLRQYESLKIEVEEALKGTEAEVGVEAPRVELEEKGMEEVIKTAPVSKMVSVILRHAVEGSASDIHVEPVGRESRVRYRVDGILHTSIILPRYVHSAIVARIKVLSNLKTDETRIPQDGRFRTRIAGKDIDYRVSTLPLINNEKVVMRILDTSSELLRLDSLGFIEKDIEIMRNNIKKSHGMMLLTGPTGSGKSTTLYAVLKILNKEEVNIVTLEDPVEYYIQGINQSQVNPKVGLTFANGLRSILRQDPNIIMVGEIRDSETAELAIHAALTGHLVLSTLHTNDAFGAIPRLIDMKVEPFLITSTVNLVAAQRLVRRICTHCQEEITLPPSLEKEVWTELNNIPKDSLPKDIKLPRPLKLYRGKGCARCENSGYKGRTVIAEVLDITEELKKIIVTNPTIDAIKKEFKRQGLFSMRQDGVLKALQGSTTIEEVWKATRE